MFRLAQGRTAIEPDTASLASLRDVEVTPTQGSSAPPIDGFDRVARVLIADDDEMVRDLLARQVRHARRAAEVVLASDGLEAVEAFSRSPFALVLLDLNMPGMGGVEAGRAMRALEAARGGGRSAIYVVSGDESADARVSVLSAGLDGLLSKALGREGLLALLDLCRV